MHLQPRLNHALRMFAVSGRRLRPHLFPYRLLIVCAIQRSAVNCTVRTMSSLFVLLKQKSSLKTSLLAGFIYALMSQ